MSEVTEKPTVKYTVQMAELDDAVLDKMTRWVDVAMITVPVGTKRRTVLKQALASMKVGDEPPRLRALDAESAEVHEPKATTTVSWSL